MDTALATEAAAATPPPEPVIETPEPKPLELEEFVHKQIEQLAAPESETEDKPAVAEAAVPAAEAEVETPKPEQSDSAQPPFTAEELRDPAFLGRLSTDGWTKLEEFNPSIYKTAKAVAHAQGVVFELKRKLEAQARPEPEKPKEPARDLRAEALAQTDSLDPEERAKGFEALALLAAERLIKPYEQVLQRTALQTEAAEVEKAAYSAALASMPEDARAEFAALDSKELDAAVEGDPDLLDDIAIAVNLEPEARVRLLAKVMRRAGKIVMEGKRSAKAAADSEAAKKEKATKDAAAQQRLRSNQSNASATVAESPTGKTPKAEKSIEETIHAKFAALPK